MEPTFGYPPAPERLKAIQDHLAASPRHRVQVLTAWKATEYAPKHSAMFRATEKDLYVQRGKSWDCLNFTLVRFV